MLPFNVDHAVRVGNFRAAFRGLQIAPGERVIVANDTKLFAQADTTAEISHFLTADEECKKKYARLQEAGVRPTFEILSIRKPLNEVLGRLDFPDPE
jgi:ribosomal protein L27